MLPRFQFKHQIVLAQLDSPEDFTRRFAKESRREPTNSLLRWQAGAGISGPVVLKSGSGNTNFVAERDLIRGQTRYFTSDYQDPSGWETRAKYSRDRLEVLLKIAERAGASPMMLSVTQVATSSVEKDDVPAVKQDCARQLGLLALSGTEAPLDFSLRSGYPIGTDCFLNVQLAWYQSRSFTVVTRPGETTTVRDWEGHVEEEGLELRLDVNNKRALFSGHLDWTSSKLVESIHAAEKQLPREYERICKIFRRAEG